jgi:acyl-CoA synthetase (NDP forming)
VRSEPAEAGRLAALQTSSGAPVLAHSMYAPDAGGNSLRAAGLAVYERTEQAARALAGLVALAEARVAPAPLAVPEPAPPLAGVVGYVEARTLLAAAGLPYPDGSVANDAGGAVAAANLLGLYPVTLKAVDASLLHKSDRGGVRVGIPDAASLHAAALEMERDLAPELLFVERTADVTDGIELIVGARQDTRFGAVVLVGLGGTLVEVLEDTALALAPIDEAAARRLLAALRGATLLQGVRGRPAVDLDAAAAAVATISRVAAAHPEIAELEVNPLLVTPSGACALDARAILQIPEELT